MPWKETCPVDQRVLFIAAYVAGDQPMTALAAQFGVSRKTAYKWLTRYRRDGPSGLDPHPPLAHSLPHRLSASVRAAILAERDAHPHWGPKKLRQRLASHGDLPVAPAASAIGRVLKAAGKIEERRRQTKPRASPTPLTTPTSPNHVWTIDFKGWFVTGDGRKCYPLTVLDSASRYLLACVGLTDTHGTTVRPIFERLFQTFGLPEIIRSDNGTPFASTGLGGFTALNVWWRRLGIQLERIEPGHPEQNGRHERFHRTLKAEVGIASDCAAQQVLFDAFEVTYNTVRPHEALGQQTPESVYTRSPRPYPAELPAPVHAPGAVVRRVRRNGSVLFAGKEVYVTPALTGESIEFIELGDGAWWVLFAGDLLGWCDALAGKIRGFNLKREGHETYVRGRPATLSAPETVSPRLEDKSVTRVEDPTRVRASYLAR